MAQDLAALQARHLRLQTALDNHLAGESVNEIRDQRGGATRFNQVNVSALRNELSGIETQIAACDSTADTARRRSAFMIAIPCD